MDDIHAIVSRQREFFAKHHPFPIDFRLNHLKKMKIMLKDNTQLLLDALYADLKKSALEAMTTEILFVINEINFVMKRLPNWMRPKRVRSLFPVLWPGYSRVYAEPYGIVFIIGAFNYPVSLILSPLIGAIAAGNAAILKPSELASHTEKALCGLIKQYFDPDYITTVTGGAAECNAVIAEKPDYIFFTGSTRVGQAIMQQAAAKLIPITLECGGKNPCIVDETAHLAFAARRIAWSKTLNAGQTCIAPDFLYVHTSIKEKMIQLIIQEWRQFFGPDPEKSADYGRLISQAHCNRLIALLKDNGRIRVGGSYSIANQYIAPTLLDQVQLTDKIMQDEIFGPLLPIVTFDSISEVIDHMSKQAKPLALYYFTSSKEREQQVLSRLSFGGGCINDCIMQVGNWHLPFGGVQQSGFGAYHGRYSFDTFSHHKAIYKRLAHFDYPLIYPPAQPKRLSWLKRILGW